MTEQWLIEYGRARVVVVEEAVIHIKPMGENFLLYTVHTVA